MLVGHIQGAFINFFRKILRKLLPLFLENVILLRLALVNSRPKLKNKQFSEETYLATFILH